MPQIEVNSAFYKQLAQNVSDSDDDDSEDEVVRFQSPPRAAANPQGVSATAMYSPAGPKIDNHPILMAPRTEQLYLHHVASGGTGNGRNFLLELDGGAGTTSDTVAILNDGGINSTNAQDDDSSTGHITGARKPMGPCRRACFCLSIFVCFASVVIFLWGLPCSSDLACPARDERIREEERQATASHNWIRDFEGVEFKSVISVTSDGMTGRGKNIIFMYRGDRIFETSPELQHQHNGILALMSDSGGKVSWYDKMTDEPSSIDCGILDVDKNGMPDCLVIDEYGQMGCINPVSGQWMWHISLYQDAANGGNSNNSSSTDKPGHRKAVDLLDFPLILPDLDDDSVKDLLLVTSLEQVHHNNFLFISGAHGRPLGKAYKLTSCDYIHKLQLEEEGINLFFNCINNDTELTKILSLGELYQLATGKELSADRLKAKKGIEQHKFYGQRKDTQNQRNIYSNGEVDLIVENSGKCPFNCTMTVAISESRGNTTLPVVLIQRGRMYGMVPAVLPKRRGVKGGFNSGFVIKFWEWLEDAEQENGDAERDQTKDNSTPGRPKRAAFPQHINWTFVKKGERRPERSRVKRDETKNDLILRRIKEHVVLVLFNGTAQKVINTSQSDVIQFCQEAAGINNFCQPDINYQENSVAIADADGDPRLISFYSSFVQTEGKEQQQKGPVAWKLVTNVQQLRLDLVSLYDT